MRKGAGMATWREISARIVYDVLEKTKGQEPKAIRKALKEAYPFGEREMHPYKVWLAEIKRQTRGKYSTRKQEPIQPLWDQAKGGGVNDGIYYDADHGVHQDGNGGVHLWEGRKMGKKMKPAYEIVRAAELRAGDVFKRDRGSCRQKVAKIGRSSTGCLDISCKDHGFLLTEDHHEVLRQLPPERNPDVLMRAIEIASSQVLETTHAMMERKSPFPSKDSVKHYAKSCIDQAIRELESEAGDERDVQ